MGKGNDGQNGLPFYKIMGTDNTIWVYNLNFMYIILLSRDNFKMQWKVSNVYVSEYENHAPCSSKRDTYGESYVDIPRKIMCTNACIWWTNFKIVIFV